jgi:hypothetical protein
MKYLTTVFQVHTQIKPGLQQAPPKPTHLLSFWNLFWAISPIKRWVHV